MFPVTGMWLHPILPVLSPPSLPLATSRDGSLFVDRDDPNLHWYLPDFAPAPDVDPLFAFAVSQTGQQANGQPFDVAKLSLRIVKQEPTQVTQFAQANPSAALREIPLDNLAAVLSSTYTDQNGNAQQRTFTASTFQDQGDGSFLLVFDGSILGDSVLAVYQDLCAFGKATIAVNGSFQSWSQSPPPIVWRRPVLMEPATTMEPARAMEPATLMEPARPVNAMAMYHPSPQLESLALAHPVAPPNSTPSPTWVELSVPYGESLPLGLKYAADGYQLRYTIATASSPSRVIIGAGDLSSFSQPQTQFAEFNELGDLSTKYPTIGRAYFGVISKTIVLIPQRYAIVRSKSGCSATCLARVDSSPSSTSQCAFEFSFVIAPEVSGIELARLTEEIAGHPDLSGYQITFADFLKSTAPSTVLTSFATSVAFAAGAVPHSFAATITVQDAGANAPAVANANILILQLSGQSGTDLIGTLNLLLDDGYPDPVTATIDLNFAQTAGTDELLVQMGESSQAIQVTNQSPLSLQMQNYALVQATTVSETAAPSVISPGGSVSFPLPPNSGETAFAYEAQLALPAAMTPSAVATFLNFQTVDVQSTQYVVALDGSGIDFTKVTSVACTVTFPSLPAITPWKTTLTANLKADSSHIQIPIENALFTLPGTVNLTVDPATPNATPFALTLQNDFTANPVMTLLQSQLVSQPPPVQPPPVQPPPPAS